jgi:hypothetical protein
MPFRYYKYVMVLVVNLFFRMELYYYLFYALLEKKQPKFTFLFLEEYKRPHHSARKLKILHQ